MCRSSYPDRPLRAAARRLPAEAGTFSLAPWRGILALPLTGQTRVERIAQTVAEQIDRQHRYRRQNSRVQDDLEINGNEISDLSDHSYQTGQLGRATPAEKRTGRS